MQASGTRLGRAKKSLKLKGSSAQLNLPLLYQSAGLDDLSNGSGSPRGTKSDIHFSEDARADENPLENAEI